MPSFADVDARHVAALHRDVLTRWLSCAGENQLAQLLRARWDVAFPAPATFDILAHRILLIPSVKYALTLLNSVELKYLDAAMVAADDVWLVDQKKLAKELEGTCDARIVDRLVTLGLLLRDKDSLWVNMMVPRAVHFGPGDIVAQRILVPVDRPAPTLSGSDHDGSDQGSTAFYEFRYDMTRLCDRLHRSGLALLGRGGIKVTDSKGLAKALGVSEQRLGFLLEIAHQAGFVELSEAGLLQPGQVYSSWLAAEDATQWLGIVYAWLTLDRRSWDINSRTDQKQVITALNPELQSTFGSLLRQSLLHSYTHTPTDHGFDDHHGFDALRFDKPILAMLINDSEFAALLKEAGWVGLICGGIAGRLARQVISNDSSVEADETVARSLLPTPVREFFIQADLTVMVPGPAERSIDDRLRVLADQESGGTAAVYRVSEKSLRRGMESGLSRDEIADFFSKHSLGVVPEVLTFLLDEVADRFGQLRVGGAQSFIRCDNPALLDQVMAVLGSQSGLRVIAPTVAVCLLPQSVLLDQLRAHSLTPVAEDFDGNVFDISNPVLQVQDGDSYRPQRLSQRSCDDATVDYIVSNLKQVELSQGAQVIAGSFIKLDGSRDTMRRALDALLDAARAGRWVKITAVSAHGVGSTIVGTPLIVDKGKVRLMIGSDTIEDVQLHRITSVALVAPPG